VRVVATKRASRKERRNGGPEWFSVVHHPSLRTLSVVWHQQRELTSAELEAHRQVVERAALTAFEPAGNA
jgi:hypothetical protein